MQGKPSLFGASTTLSGFAGDSPGSAGISRVRGSWTAMIWLTCFRRLCDRNQFFHHFSRDMSQFRPVAVKAWTVSWSGVR